MNDSLIASLSPCACLPVGRGEGYGEGGRNPTKPIKRGILWKRKRSLKRSELEKRLRY